VHLRKEASRSHDEHGAIYLAPLSFTCGHMPRIDEPAVRSADSACTRWSSRDPSSARTRQLSCRWRARTCSVATPTAVAATSSFGRPCFFDSLLGAPAARSS